MYLQTLQQEQSLTGEMRRRWRSHIAEAYRFPIPSALNYSAQVEGRRQVISDADQASRSPGSEENQSLRDMLLFMRQSLFLLLYILGLRAGCLTFTNQRLINTGSHSRKLMSLACGLTPLRSLSARLVALPPRLFLTPRPQLTRLISVICNQWAPY